MTNENRLINNDYREITKESNPEESGRLHDDKIAQIDEFIVLPSFLIFVLSIVQSSHAFT